MGKDGKAIEDQNHAEEHHSAPGQVGLEGRLEWEGVPVDVMKDQRPAEAGVGQADGEPREQVCDRDQARKPFEHVRTPGRDGHVGQKPNGRRDTDACEFQDISTWCFHSHKITLWAHSILGHLAWCT